MFLSEGGAHGEQARRLSGGGDGCLAGEQMVQVKRGDLETRLLAQFAREPIMRARLRARRQHG